MTAELEERARRRLKELEERGKSASLAEIIENLAERDRIDSNRTENPLVKADDATVIDTTHLEFHEQVAKIVALACEAMQTQ